MAEVLQMPSYGLDDPIAEREEQYRQQFDSQRLQDRMEARQQAEAQTNQEIGVTAIKKETDDVIRLFRLITALNPLTFIWYVLETTARYITANLLGFEWPGVWQKVSKVERWVMFGANGLLIIITITAIMLLVVLNPAVFTQLSLGAAFDELKKLGCQIYSCSQ